MKNHKISNQLHENTVKVNTFKTLIVLELLVNQLYKNLLPSSFFFIFKHFFEKLSVVPPDLGMSIKAWSFGMRWLFQLKLLHMIYISWKNYKILKFWVLDFGFGLQIFFFGLWRFFWDLWYLTSPVVCKNYISEQYFMPNSFCC